MIVEGVKVIPDDVGLYAPDDIPAFVEKYRKQTAKMPRKRRTDFSKGMIVIVLEGAFSSARVVYLRKEENYLALCAGPKSVNGIPFFKIDERYLLTTSTILDFSEDIRIDSKNVYESVRDVYMEPIDVEMTEEEKKLDSALAEASKKVRFMRNYLLEPFWVDPSKNFYSMKY